VAVIKQTQRVVACEDMPWCESHVVAVKGTDHKEARILRKNNQPLTSKHYQRLKRYDVMKIGDTQKRTESGLGENDDSNICYYCKTDEVFDVLETAHVNIGHKR